MQVVLWPVIQDIPEQEQIVTEKQSLTLFYRKMRRILMKSIRVGLKKPNKRALIAEGCLAPPVEFPSLFAQEQTFPSHPLAQFLLCVGCEMQTQHDREAPAEEE